MILVFIKISLSQHIFSLVARKLIAPLTNIVELAKYKKKKDMHELQETTNLVM